MLPAPPFSLQQKASPALCLMKASGLGILVYLRVREVSSCESERGEKELVREEKRGGRGRGEGGERESGGGVWGNAAQQGEG